VRRPGSSGFVVKNTISLEEVCKMGSSDSYDGPDLNELEADQNSNSDSSGMSDLSSDSDDQLDFVDTEDPAKEDEFGQPEFKSIPAFEFLSDTAQLIQHNDRLRLQSCVEASTSCTNTTTENSDKDTTKKSDKDATKTSDKDKTTTAPGGAPELDPAPMPTTVFVAGAIMGYRRPGHVEIPNNII